MKTSIYTQAVISGLVLNPWYRWFSSTSNQPPAVDDPDASDWLGWDGWVNPQSLRN